MCCRSDGEVLAFAETSAILNYSKASAFSGILRNLPNRVFAMQSFIDKGLSAGVKINTSKKVLDQLAYARDMLEKELLAKGLEPKKIASVVQVATEAIKVLLTKINSTEVESDEHLPKIKAFFEKHKFDREMLDARETKETKTGKVYDLLPEESDMKIFADALELNCDYFITADGHFCLDELMLTEFGIDIINQFNAKAKGEQIFGA